MRVRRMKKTISNRKGLIFRLASLSFSKFWAGYPGRTSRSSLWPDSVTRVSAVGCSSPSVPLGGLESGAIAPLGLGEWQ